MKWIRRLLKGISLTAAMFVFQACYGPMDDYYDTRVTFRVVSADTGEPIQGVEIWSQHLNSTDSLNHSFRGYYEGQTDENGMITCWEEGGLMKYSLFDKDSVYSRLDTIFNPMDVDTVDIAMKPVNQP